MAAVRQCADSLQAAVAEYRQCKADFAADEKDRGRAKGVIAKLRACVAMRGPAATDVVSPTHAARVAAATGESRAIRMLGARRTWRQRPALAGGRPRCTSHSRDWEQLQ